MLGGSCWRETSSLEQEVRKGPWRYLESRATPRAGSLSLGLTETPKCVLHVRKCCGSNKQTNDFSQEDKGQPSDGLVTLRQLDVFDLCCLCAVGTTGVTQSLLKRFAPNDAGTDGLASYKKQKQGWTIALLQLPWIFLWAQMSIFVPMQSLELSNFGLFKASLIYGVLPKRHVC